MDEFERARLAAESFSKKDKASDIRIRKKFLGYSKDKSPNQPEVGVRKYGVVRGKVNCSIYCDGSCSPNPGPMGIGVFCPETNYRLSQHLGVGTNNVAEWLALEQALSYAIEVYKHSRPSLTIHGDSSLIINGITQRWRVRNPNLKEIYKRCLKLKQGLDVEFVWIPRERNTVADSLSTVERETNETNR